MSEEIEDRIRNGKYVSSQKLPSEYDLANEFDCSRLTIRKAIDDLIKKKIIVKKRGKGSYIMPLTKIQSGRSGLQSFTEAAKSYGKSSKTNVISLTKVSEPNEAIRVALQLNEDDTIYELVRCRFLDDDPMTVEKIYLPEKLIKDIPEKQFENSLFVLLEEKVDIAYSIQEVEAILVDEEMSSLLEIPIGDPLLQVNSIAYEVDATPIFFDTSFYRADKYSFKNTLTRLPS